MSQQPCAGASHPQHQHRWGPDYYACRDVVGIADGEEAKGCCMVYFGLGQRVRCFTTSPKSSRRLLATDLSCFVSLQRHDCLLRPHSLRPRHAQQPRCNLHPGLRRRMVCRRNQHRHPMQLPSNAQALCEAPSSLAQEPNRCAQRRCLGRPRRCELAAVTWQEPY